MPFLQEGTSAESNYVDRQPAQLLVDPDQVLFVKRGFEDERDRIQQWILRNRHRLNTVPAPGTDPCSKHTVRALGENGEAATRAAEGYVDQLTQVAEALGAIAQSYGLVEDGNTQRFAQEHR